jgi:nicotinate phosphoribosyltransferase
VDIYAVGSSFYQQNVDFTADVVLLDGQPCAKAGRVYRANPRLERAL